MMCRLSFVMILLLGGLNPASGHELSLTVVLSERSGAYLQFYDALNRQLADRQITIHVQDAETPLKQTDLLIAVGTKAASSILQGEKYPVLSVMLPREGYAQILGNIAAQQKHEARQHSAIYIDQPPSRQFDLIRALFPKVRSVGVLYSSVPDELGMIRLQAKSHGLDLVEKSVANSSLLPVSLQELLVSCDVMLALPDTSIYNPSTIRNILLATYRNRVPLIGFSMPYVRAGALAAIFSRPEQIASQAAAVVQEYADSHVLPAPQYAKEFDVAVNEQVAHSLGLNIQSEAQLRAVIGKSP